MPIARATGRPPWKPRPFAWMAPLLVMAPVAMKMRMPPAQGLFGFGSDGVPPTSCQAVATRLAPAGTFTVVYSGTLTTCETCLVYALTSGFVRVSVWLPAAPATD